MRSGDATGSAAPALGLKANWRQFSLLVLVNAFVGAMAGAERVVLPLLAESEFAVASRTAALSFLVSFGIVKALANLAAGRASESAGRKKVLVLGWLAGLPVPVLIYFAPSWKWVVIANVLLGMNQGLCWSTTVIMKIDLVGPWRRGFAMGLNEAAGYLAVALAAFVSGSLAASQGLRAAPAIAGGCAAAAGLLVSVLFVKDTLPHVRHESGAGLQTRPFKEVFWLTTWRNRSLFSISQAGLVNNLNDGMAWGLLPLYFASRGLPLGQISALAALYPAVWGVAQLVTGGLSDRFGRKVFIAFGMVLQGLAVFAFVAGSGFAQWLAAAVALGLGTAMVYPALLAGIGDVAQPAWRASAVGVYRLWRDSGYAVGALFAGAVADSLGLEWAIGAVGVVTLLSGIVVARLMKETRGASHGLNPDAGGGELRQRHGAAPDA